MKAYTSNNIRNIAVLGHGGKGKTTLCEAMLYIAGASDRLGRVADGNTVLDFDSEENAANRPSLPPWRHLNGITQSSIL